MKQVREIIMPIRWNEDEQVWEAAVMDNGQFAGIESRELSETLIHALSGRLSDAMNEHGGGHRYVLRLEAFDPTPPPVEKK